MGGLSRDFKEFQGGTEKIQRGKSEFLPTARLGYQRTVVGKADNTTADHAFSGLERSQRRYRKARNRSGRRTVITVGNSDIHLEPAVGHLA